MASVQMFVALMTPDPTPSAHILRPLEHLTGGGERGGGVLHRNGSIHKWYIAPLLSMVLFSSCMSQLVSLFFLVVRCSSGNTKRSKDDPFSQDFFFVCVRTGYVVFIFVFWIFKFLLGYLIGFVF